MHDFLGNRVKQALPGEPVEVLGFDGVPEAGEHVRVVENERRARQLAGERANRLKTESLARRAGKRISLEDIFKSGLQELNLVLKADVAGSLEAIEDEIAKLPQDEVSVNVIRRARRRRDRVRRDARRRLRRGDPRVQRAPRRRRPPGGRPRGRRDPPLLGDLPRDRGAARRDAGHARARGGRGGRSATAEVRQIFRASRVGTIAGSHVTDGKITRGVEGAPGARRHGRLRRRDRRACGASTTTSARSPPASTAASCCETSPTSRKATCSRPTPRARSSASSPSGRPRWRRAASSLCS